MDTSEHKQHDEEAKQQQQTAAAAAIHRKPGTLGEKLNVLGHAAADSVAPATQWVRTKAAAILHPSDSGKSKPIDTEPAHVAMEREARDEGKWESEGGAALDESVGAVSTSSAVPAAPINSVHAVHVSSTRPGVGDALRDVGEHLGESMSHLIEPAVKAFKELTDPAGAQTDASKPGSSGVSSSAAAVGSAPGSSLATPSAVNSISASSNALASPSERAAEKASLAAQSNVASLSQEQKEAEMNKMKKKASGKSA